MSTVATASSGALFVFERICTAISSELANRMIERNYQTGEGDWQNSPDRAPLLWLPQRTRLLFFPLLRFRQGFIDFLDLLTAYRFTTATPANFTIIAFVGLLAAIVAAARVFLVVEAFISLRSNPSQMHNA